MPWSPIPKFPEIIQNIRRGGYTKEVTTALLEIEIMRSTGLTRPSTISRTIQIMEQLGFIHRHPNSPVWILGKKETEKIKKEEIEDEEKAISDNYGVKE